MERYFYHGRESYFGLHGYNISVMINILQNDGLKIRNEVRDYQDSEYAHVCLYKKNEGYDYTEENALLKSARGGWIDGCFVFVLSPDVPAIKVKYNNGSVGFDENNNPITNLVDEWRSIGSISNEKIKGIAIPFDEINEYLNGEIDKDKGILKDKKLVIELLPKLINLAENMGLFIVNSNEKDFVDRLDNELNRSKKSNRNI